MEKQDLRKVTVLRKELHQYPELSGKEQATAEKLLGFFKALKPDEILEKIGGFGFMVVFSGKEKGPAILLRSELDALPIEEENSFRHKSKNHGIAHLCGHDGHMAILCGVGMGLSKKRPKSGKVILLFQPSEETGEGAQKMIQSKAFKMQQPDYTFAMHNLPGYDTHKIVLKKGPFTAASKGMEIRIKGTTSHAAHPEDGNSPAEAMCKIIIALEKLPDAIKKFSLVTVVNAILGEKAYGTSPGKAIVRATLRSYDNKIMDDLTYYCEKLAEKIAREYDLKVSFSYTEEFQVSNNDPEAWEYVNEAAKKLNLKISHIRVPFRWSEDFGHFAEASRAMLFGIGAGIKHPQLHEPSYDFPDEIIPTGIRLFTGIIQQITE